MISIIKFNKILQEIKHDLNQQIKSADNQIAVYFISPTESHFIKKIKDSKGIILAARMPDSDTMADSDTNFNEQNHVLIYILEKTDPGKYSHIQEVERYEILQQIMRSLKCWVMNRFSWTNDQMGEIRLAKEFHTEWEYQLNGCNGLSISFDLEDYEL